MTHKETILDVSMSAWKVASEDTILRTVGIGSCVVITLYDAQKRIGALAHPMMSKSKGHQGNSRYIEDAVDDMVKHLIHMGARKERLVAKIVGGAHMFKVFDNNPQGIGVQNIQATKDKLNALKIKIVGNDTGGNVGRSVLFYLNDGIIEVKTKI